MQPITGIRPGDVARARLVQSALGAEALGLTQVGAGDGSAAGGRGGGGLASLELRSAGAREARRRSSNPRLVRITSRPPASGGEKPPPCLGESILAALGLRPPQHLRRPRPVSPGLAPGSFLGAVTSCQLRPVAGGAGAQAHCGASPRKLGRGSCTGLARLAFLLEDNCCPARKCS